MHLSPWFSEACQRISQVIREGGSAFEVRVAVMQEGVPILSQWFTGKTFNVSGHPIYGKLVGYRLANGEKWLDALAEFAGKVITEKSGLKGSFHHLGTWRFPKALLKRAVSGDVEGLDGTVKLFDFEEVLDDFLWNLNTTAKRNLSADELYQDETRLVKLADLLTPFFQILGCGGAVEELSWAAVLKAAKKFIDDAKPLETRDWRLHERFMKKKPYGLLLWFHRAITGDVRWISKLFEISDPSVCLENRLVPSSDKECAGMLALSKSTLNAEVAKQLIAGRS